VIVLDARPRSLRARSGRVTVAAMSYIDGFVIPVAATAKDRFVAHAKRMDGFFQPVVDLRR
jgi:hypothetical protein